MSLLEGYLWKSYVSAHVQAFAAWRPRPKKAGQPSPTGIPLQPTRAALGILLAVPVFLLCGVALTEGSFHRELLTFSPPNPYIPPRGPTVLDILATAALAVGLLLEFVLVLSGIVSLGVGRRLGLVGAASVLASLVGFLVASISALLWLGDWLLLTLICGFAWSECQMDLWSPFIRGGLWCAVAATYSLRGLGWAVVGWRMRGPASAAMG